jgi:hypothetical protein
MSALLRSSRFKPDGITIAMYFMFSLCAQLLEMASPISAMACFCVPSRRTPSVRAGDMTNSSNWRALCSALLQWRCDRYIMIATLY